MNQPGLKVKLYTKEVTYPIPGKPYFDSNGYLYTHREGDKIQSTYYSLCAIDIKTGITYEITPPKCIGKFAYYSFNTNPDLVYNAILEPSTQNYPYSGAEWSCTILNKNSHYVQDESFDLLESMVNTYPTNLLPGLIKDWIKKTKNEIVNYDNR